MEALKAIILGIVEGVTEFLPVSSTGHLIIASNWLRYPEEQRATFEIFIQMGAILAVYWHYRVDLLDLARRSARQESARALIGKVFVAFLPAAAVGLLIHHWIEDHLFSIRAVAGAFIVGGLVIWLIELRPRRPTVTSIETMTWREAVWIGIAQVTSLYPGVSRSAATIIGGLLSGMDRPSATQFSFYLALPTLTAASLFSLAKAWKTITPGEASSLALGFVTAFIVALLVIRGFLRYVQSHDFRPFAYYRIVAGALLLLFLS